ncbi:MAG TPA: MtrB/PioB family decaheme-associated outer membrane protein [Thermoanaerobaculia bacterium]|nr:MtrB/PioB family decaheme-associated outer membrane protein [Thermoanaerobaculia bacterium]
MAENRKHAIFAPALLLLGGLLLSPAAGAQGMVFHLDPLVLEILETDVDSELDTFQFRDNPSRVESAKFSEYRDLKSGFRLRELHLWGEDPDGDRYFDFRGENVGRQDARLGLQYGTWGGWSLDVDYNKIVHRFGNRALFLWNITGPGRFEIPDPVQAQIQGAIEQQRAISPGSVNYAFLLGLLTPYLDAANTLDIGLRRDRTDVGLDLGTLGGLGWRLELQHENRNGLRPYGGSFGFGNAPEIVEPIDYDTSSAELRGEWSAKRAGLQFGYRYSQFENNISTLIWDNPFRATDSTDPIAYTAPGGGSIGGAAMGFADLAPDNHANLAFVNGRARFAGNWHATGRASYQVLTQDDPLLPYTLNSAIVGVDFDGSPFDPTDPANLPARNADNEVTVLNLAADVGTTFADRFDLDFRYRYYDYDNDSRRIAFPGYVRFHGVWEEIGRISVPYAYRRESAAVELGWEINPTSDLELAYELRSWDREFRETEGTDEDAVRLTFDTRAIPNLTLRTSYEIGDRSIDGSYRTAAQEESFLAHGEPNNHPGMRKFLQAAREYHLWNVMAMYLIGDSMSLTVTAQGRDEEYDRSQFGLRDAEELNYGIDLGRALRPGMHVNVFANREEIDYRLLSRQSGATPSTDPRNDWSGDFEDVTDTVGLGFTCDGCGRWELQVQGRWSQTEGDLDLFSPPGGTPDLAFDIPNYDDVELLQLDARLDYRISERVSAGVWWLWEDYDIDSFLTRGLVPYLPAAPLLDLVNGGYEAHVVGLNMKFRL